MAMSTYTSPLEAVLAASMGDEEAARVLYGAAVLEAETQRSAVERKAEALRRRRRQIEKEWRKSTALRRKLMNGAGDGTMSALAKLAGVETVTFAEAVEQRRVSALGQFDALDPTLERVEADVRAAEAVAWDAQRAWSALRRLQPELVERVEKAPPPPPKKKAAGEPIAEKTKTEETEHPWTALMRQYRGEDNLAVIGEWTEKGEDGRYAKPSAGCALRPTGPGRWEVVEAFDLQYDPPPAGQTVDVRDLVQFLGARAVFANTKKLDVERKVVTAAVNGLNSDRWEREQAERRAAAQRPTLPNPQMRDQLAGLVAA